MKKAIALKYKKAMVAPIVVAKEEGRLAEHLLEIAQKANVSVVQEEWLPEVLYTTEVGQMIPVELYEVIAKIFAALYNTKDLR